MFAPMSQDKPAPNPKAARLAAALKRNIARRKAATKPAPSGQAPSGT